MSSEQTGHLEAEEPVSPPQENLTLGEKLRRARYSKGISLEEAARAIRINASTLKALEEDDRQAALPAPTFTRGFVRLYAAYLGLDQEEALQQHIKEQGLSATATTEKVNIQEMMAGESLAVAPRSLTGSRVFLLLLLIMVGFTAYWGYNSHFLPTESTANYSPETVYDQPDPVAPLPRETAPPPEMAPETKPAPAIEQVPEIIAAGEPEPGEEAPAHVVVANFVEDTWLQVQVDDEPSQELFAPPGYTTTWEGRERIELRIGNAGGVELSYNNEPQPPLGRSGEVVYISFP